MNVKVAHVEAGLRSFDMTMPEEINRVLTDRISDIFLLQQSTRMKIWLERLIGPRFIWLETQ